jgi:geranylgeranyl transferase type-2 subunit beta
MCCFHNQGLQDTDAGGIADRPGDVADVFHTLFGVAALSLLGHPGLVDLDPVYCMPAQLIADMGLKKGWTALPRRTEQNLRQTEAKAPV